MHIHHTFPKIAITILNTTSIITYHDLNQNELDQGMHQSPHWPSRLSDWTGLLGTIWVAYYDDHDDYYHDDGYHDHEKCDGSNCTGMLGTIWVPYYDDQDDDDHDDYYHDHDNCDGSNG